MARSTRSAYSTRKPSEKSMPTRPRINQALSHEAFTRAARPVKQGSLR